MLSIHKGYLIGLLLLCACTTDPSTSISKHVVSDLESISKEISATIKDYPPECKEMASKLVIINNQVNSVKGQVESISLACDTEKKVLESKITTRNTTIVFMLACLGFLLYTLLKKK